jgi:hypothetical protein
VEIRSDRSSQRYAPGLTFTIVAPLPPAVLTRPLFPRLPRPATEMTGDVLSHHIWGPRKKSWGIEMTIITSFMRGAARHTALVDIVCILFALGPLHPLLIGRIGHCSAPHEYSWSSSTAIGRARDAGNFSSAETEITRHSRRMRFFRNRISRTLWRMGGGKEDLAKTPIRMEGFSESPRYFQGQHKSSQTLEKEGACYTLYPRR